MVGRKRNTVDSYFLAGRGMNWVLVNYTILIHSRFTYKFKCIL